MINSTIFPTQGQGDPRDILTFPDAVRTFGRPFANRMLRHRRHHENDLGVKFWPGDTADDLVYLVDREGWSGKVRS